MNGPKGNVGRRPARPAALGAIPTRAPVVKLESSPIKPAPQPIQPRIRPRVGASATSPKPMTTVHYQPTPGADNPLVDGAEVGDVVGAAVGEAVAEVPPRATTAYWSPQASDAHPEGSVTWRSTIGLLSDPTELVFST
jgi:hypothetical protein